MDEKQTRQSLSARLRELQEEDRLSEADRSPVTLDQESVGRLSRIDAMQVQEMANAAYRRRQAEKDRIGAAMKRLDQGEYGYCVTCGEAVAQKRLEHDPSVATCIGCAGGPPQQEPERR